MAQCRHYEQRKQPLPNDRFNLMMFDWTASVLPTDPFNFLPNFCLDCTFFRIIIWQAISPYTELELSSTWKTIKETATIFQTIWKTIENGSMALQIIAKPIKNHSPQYCILFFLQHRRERSSEKIRVFFNVFPLTAWSWLICCLVVVGFLLSLALLWRYGIDSISTRQPHTPTHTHTHRGAVAETRHRYNHHIDQTSPAAHHVREQLDKNSRPKKSTKIKKKKQTNK